MNKKGAISMLVGGLISVVVSMLAMTVGLPHWLPIMLKILGFIFPAIGLTVLIPNLDDLADIVKIKKNGYRKELAVFLKDTLKKRDTY